MTDMNDLLLKAVRLIEQQDAQNLQLFKTIAVQAHTIGLYEKLVDDTRHRMTLQEELILTAGDIWKGLMKMNELQSTIIKQGSVATQKQVNLADAYSKQIQAAMHEYTKLFELYGKGVKNEVPNVVIPKPDSVQRDDDESQGS